MKKKLGAVLLVVVILTLGLLPVGRVGVALAQSPSTIAWLHQFGTSALDWAMGVAVDGDGNAYVVGFTEGSLPGQTSSGDYDAFVRKYDSSGSEVWTRQFGTSASDWATGVAVDGDGNVYVVGKTGESLSGQPYSGDDDAFVRKYDSLGNELWTRQFGTSSWDYATGVAVDGDGNAYVVGKTGESLSGQPHSGGEDAFVRKYDSLGNELWTRQFGTSAHDLAIGVAVDGDGNVYVVGWTEGGTFLGQTSSGGGDAFVRKYDSLGNELWTRQFGTSAFDSAMGVAVDGDGNVYVAGSTEGTLPYQPYSGDEDAFVRKYDSLGNELWTRQFGTSALDWAMGVAVDGDGNVYVVGFIEGSLPGQTSSGGEDAFVRKYDSSGNELWTHQFGTSAHDWATGVAVDGDGNVYVAGFIEGTLPDQTSSGGRDAFIVKFAEPNQPPVADANRPYMVQLGSTATLDGSLSTDPEGDLLEYRWDFENDGDWDTAWSASPSSVYQYAEVGVYDAVLSVRDPNGAESTDNAIVVVYDSEGGFVTGGGWIYSKAGADLMNPSAEGKAAFGFVSKYKKGATEPTGQTQFQFKAGDLNFHSSEYEWLVVNQDGTNAQFKGTGTINGTGEYKFMLWAGDGDPDTDTFRIKIWQEDETGMETVRYDNGFDQTIEGGSIVIHAKK